MRWKLLVLIFFTFSLHTCSLTKRVYDGNERFESVVKEDNKCGDDLIWSHDPKQRTLTITGTGPMYNYSSQSPWYNLRKKIKTIYIDPRVTSIGNKSFYDCGFVSDIIIPENVSYIGESAFRKCASLNNVTIPARVSNIGLSAFSWCEVLTSINVDSGNVNYKSLDGVLFSYDGASLIQYPMGISNTSYSIPDNVSLVGCDAFAGNKYLEDVTIPESVKSIEDYAFNECANLKNISLPDGVQSIGKRAFLRCSSLIKVTFSSNLSSIGEFAFYNCSSLTHIMIPDSVSQINDCAFSSCSRLQFIEVGGNNTKYKSVDGVLFNHNGSILLQYPSGNMNRSYIIPDNVNTIKSDAFVCNDYLRSVTIPNTVKTIGRYTFNNCRNLTNVIIPDGVISIDSLAFCQCHSLATLAIPASVSSIKDDAFFWCMGLVSIAVDEQNSDYKSIDGVLFSIDGSSLLLYPMGKRDKIYLVPDNVITIKKNAFAGCNLERVAIPSTVSRIEESAFNYTSLVSIFYLGTHNISQPIFAKTIPDNVCVVPDFEYSTFGDANVTSDTDRCKEFRSMINNCFNESQTTAWTSCISDANAIRTCVNNQCIENSTLIDGKTTIEIALDLQVHLSSLKEMIDFMSERCEIDQQDMLLGTEIDAEGNVLRVFVYVSDEDTANRIIEVLSICMRND